MGVLTEDIISAAKLSEFFPTSQSTFSDPDDLLIFANQEIKSKLVPWMMSCRQDYFGTSKFIPLRNGVNHYSTPERAIGNSIKDVFYVPNTTTPDSRYPLPLLQMHEGFGTSLSGGRPTGIRMQGDEIIIVPTPTGLSGLEALWVPFYERPNQLVATSKCAKITAISSVGGTTTFTVDTDLTGALSAGSLLDFLSRKSPYRLWAKDVAITAITATTIAVLTPDVSDEGSLVEPVLNDYICPAQTTCIPMFPDELHPIVSEMICWRAMKSLGAAAKLQTCAGAIGDMLKGAFKILSNRVEGEPELACDPSGPLSMINAYSGGGYIRS